MSNEYRIKPYTGVSITENVFEFGMSDNQVKNMDLTIYNSYLNAETRCERIEHGGYHMFFYDDLLEELVLRFSMKDGKPFNIISVDDMDVSCFDSVEELKKKHLCFLSRDRNRTLFPELGIVAATEPFMEHLSIRKGAFWNTVTAFSKERLLSQQTALHVLRLHPLMGVSFAGSEIIKYGMTQEEVDLILGMAEHVFRDFSIMKHIVEIRYGQGIEFRYTNRITKDSKDEYDPQMPLSEITINEKHNWEVEIEGIRLFEDDKLSQMKCKYEHIDSPKGKATIFPTLGLTVCGCGEKKDRVNGKYAVVFEEADVDSKIRGLYLHD